MDSRHIHIKRKSTVAINDLLFTVENNTLSVSKGTESLSTSIFSEEILILEAFCSQASQIVSPVPGNTLVYSNDEGDQELTLMKDEKDNYTLIINNQVQFTTNSEEIYHEALVHPAIEAIKRPVKDILILGGGDGLAAKQIFKHYPEAEVTLVDFDANMLELFLNDEVMKKFNEAALSKCYLVNYDAFEYVQDNEDRYDVIICDFPDPDHEIFNKLYSQEFYANVKKLLKPGGSLAVQSGSLVTNSKTYKCIIETIQSVGLKTLQYYTPVSYGELCYCLAMEEEPSVVFTRKYNTLDQNYFDKAMRTFRPGLISSEPVEINTIDNMQALEYRTVEIKGQHE